MSDLLVELKRIGAIIRQTTIELANCIDIVIGPIWGFIDDFYRLRPVLESLMTNFGRNNLGLNPNLKLSENIEGTVIEEKAKCKKPKSFSKSFHIDRLYFFQIFLRWSKSEFDRMFWYRPIEGWFRRLIGDDKEWCWIENYGYFKDLSGGPHGDAI